MGILSNLNHFKICPRWCCIDLLLHPFHPQNFGVFHYCGGEVSIIGSNKSYFFTAAARATLERGERGGYSIWHSGRLASTSILSSWSNCHKENFGTTSIVWEHLSKYKYSNNAQIWHCFNWSQIFSQHCPVFVMPPVFMSKKMEEWQPFTLFEGIWHVDLKKGWGRG